MTSMLAEYDLSGRVALVTGAGTGLGAEIAAALAEAGADVALAGRRPAPLRDVAGMLRSLDYAARTAGAPPTWLDEARAGLLAGYGAIDGDHQALLDAFELEKACYEIRYEAGNRPHWLALPLAAVARLARQD